MNQNEVKVLRLLMIGGHEWAYFLVAYLMTIMATFLTGVWELSITHASQIMNLYSGTVVILPVVMNTILPCCMRSLHFTLVVSKIAFALGLVLLTISASGTCKEDEPLCIGIRKRILFITSLFVIAVAVSSHETWTEKKRSRSEETWRGSCRSCCEAFADLVFPYGALALIGYISPWWIKFLIPTIYAALCLFWDHSFLNDDNEDVTGAVHYALPEISDDDTSGSTINDALLESGDDMNGWTSTVYVIYVCICSILVNVVFTIGNTFFILQAIDLNPKLWFIPIAAVSLPIIKESVKPDLGCITCGDWGLKMSMIFATLCCITAAKVETRRLGVVVSEGVVDDSDAIIPMTIFWLVPQYVLLGYAEKSFSDYLKYGLNKVIGKTYVIGRIIGATGFYGGVLSVYIVGRFKPTWIQKTVNTSRLDNYYWFLATISAINLVLFVLIMPLVVCLCTKIKSLIWLLCCKLRVSVGVSLV